MMNKIKKARIAADLTQEEVFEILGLPVKIQQNWESGKRAPDSWLEEMIIREYARVARILGQVQRYQFKK